MLVSENMVESLQGMEVNTCSSLLNKKIIMIIKSRLLYCIYIAFFSTDFFDPKVHSKCNDMYFCHFWCRTQLQHN